MLIDSHCHLDDYTDLDGVLARACAAEVKALLAIGIGNGPDDMHRALEIARGIEADRQTPIASGSDRQEARNVPQVYASAGIHPQEAHRCDETALAKLATLAADPLCLAIGEIGLDYYHADNPDKATQQAAFVAQMKLAAAARKPITLHIRTSELARPEAKAKFEDGSPDAAWDDVLALLHEHWQPTGLGGIMHCFSGNAAQAEASLALGFHLSFAGNVTYAKSTVIQQVASCAPADRILVETDAPFLTPQPLRGKVERNEPANIVHTAAFVASLRGITPEALAAATTANFLRLFQLEVA
jgi:TatD DNase family protein